MCDDQRHGHLQQSKASLPRRSVTLEPGLHILQDMCGAGAEETPSEVPSRSAASGEARPAALLLRLLALPSAGLSRLPFSRGGGQ